MVAAIVLAGSSACDGSSPTPSTPSPSLSPAHAIVDNYLQRLRTAFAAQAPGDLATVIYRGGALTAETQLMQRLSAQGLHRDRQYRIDGEPEVLLNSYQALTLRVVLHVDRDVALDTNGHVQRTLFAPGTASTVEMMFLQTVDRPAALYFLTDACPLTGPSATALPSNSSLTAACDDVTAFPF